jgi:hypothetical protein
VSLVGGFAYLDGRPFVYTTERFEPSETFISYDGGYLYAIAAYDAFLNGAEP